MPLCFTTTSLYCLAVVLCQRMTSMMNWYCRSLTSMESTQHQTPNLADLLVQIAVFGMEAFFYIQTMMSVLQACWKTNTTHTEEVPALCQTTKCDCHSMWHSPSFDGVCSLWFAHHESKQQQQQSTASVADTASASGVARGPGCPRGSVNKRKCRENYRSRLFWGLYTDISEVSRQRHSACICFVVHCFAYFQVNK